MGRGRGSWVRREDKEDTRCYRCQESSSWRPTTTARFPSESSHLAQPSACTHTHACTHNHMRASQCLAPYGEVRRVFIRDQLSMYIIYIFLKKKKTSLVLWWRRWGSWRHPEGRHARHPHAHHGDKVRRVHGRRRRRGWGIHHAGGTRWRRRRRGRGPGRQRRLDPGGQGHHSGVALHLRGSWRSCGSRLLLLPWRDGPCASARGGSRRIWGSKEAQGHTRGGTPRLSAAAALGQGGRGAPAPCFGMLYGGGGRAGGAVLVMGVEGWAGLPWGQPHGLWA